MIWRRYFVSVRRTPIPWRWSIRTFYELPSRHSGEIFGGAEMGSHSARKGSSSHTASGTTVSPPMVSICLWAMWSIETVPTVWKAGDQYLGCWYVASMSTINRLPHRHHSLILIMNLESRADDIYTLIKDYMVQGYHISARVHRIFYCCFASLRFHHCHSWWRWQQHSTSWRRRWQCSRQRSIHHCSSEWEETKV